MITIITINNYQCTIISHEKQWKNNIILFTSIMIA